MNTFLRHNAKYMKARKFKNAIIDQGHWQNIISVFEDKIAVKNLERYIKYFIYPDKLFIFNLGNEQRRARMARRGHGARDNYDEDYKEKWLEATKHNDGALRQIAGNIPVDYFFIDAARPVNELLEIIYKNFK